MRTWEGVEIADGRCLLWRVGPLWLWLRRLDDEWHLATRRDAEETALRERTVAFTDHVPADLEWSRWVTGAEAGQVRVIPVMPDLPVLVRPNAPVRVPPGRRALFYLKVPVWLRVSVVGSQPTQLVEVPALESSRTWFGDPVHGELCYSLTTQAARQLRPEDFRGHRAICPVTVRNASQEELDFQRICVRAPHLRVYEGDKHLWTNDVEVSFRGLEQGSTVDYSRKQPAYEPIRGLLGPERRSVARGLVVRSFTQLSSLNPFQGI